MKFKKVTPTQNYSKARYLSTNGLWEVGLSPVLFGVRVRAGIRGEMGVAVDYCGGADKGFQVKLLKVIMAILEKFPEDAYTHEVEQVMPRYLVKPIHNDPCWDRLQLMSKLPLGELLELPAYRPDYTTLK